MVGRFETAAHGVYIPCGFSSNFLLDFDPGGFFGLGGLGHRPAGSRFDPGDYPDRRVSDSIGLGRSVGIFRIKTADFGRSVAGSIRDSFRARLDRSDSDLRTGRIFGFLGPVVLATGR